MRWKPGRGLLGPLAPLIGTWRADVPNPMGSGTIACTRRFAPLWDNAYIELEASWAFAPDRAYRERALFGRGGDGSLHFWSFTSDGKNSTGTLVAADDVDPQAIAFSAVMPAGVARMVYWPCEDGFCFAVESQTKKGWNRFTEHRYRADAPAT